MYIILNSHRQTFILENSFAFFLFDSVNNYMSITIVKFCDLPQSDDFFPSRCAYVIVIIHHYRLLPLKCDLVKFIVCFSLCQWLYDVLIRLIEIDRLPLERHNNSLESFAVPDGRGNLLVNIAKRYLTGFEKQQTSRIIVL